MRKQLPLSCKMLVFKQLVTCHTTECKMNLRGTNLEKETPCCEGYIWVEKRTSTFGDAGRKMENIKPLKTAL